MADLNHSIKKTKVAEPSEEPLNKHISSKKIRWSTQKSLINLEPKTLSLQRIKRTKSSRWTVSLQQKRKGVSKRLSQAIAFDKNIQTLFLSLLPRDQDLFNLTHALKKLKSLKQITLDCSLFRNTDEGLYSLMKGLTGSHCLKSVSLRFCCCERITDAGLKYTSGSLKRMLLLKEIYLHFPQLSQATDQGLLKLHGSFNHLKRLENLTIKTPFCKKMTGLNFSLKRLIFLRKIHIDFTHCADLTDVGVDSIVLGLKGLPNLQQITFDFYYCLLLSDLSLNSIWAMMKSLPSLQEISLYFSSEKITDAGFANLDEILKDFSLIRKFCLHFNRCPGITDNGIDFLCQAVDRAFSLENICFSFSGCPEITDIGVKKTIDFMRRLPHLRGIEIDFGENVNVTDISLNEIYQFLQSNVALETITVGISEMEGTTEKCWNEFVQKVNELNIQRPGLEINFN